MASRRNMAVFKSTSPQVFAIVFALFFVSFSPAYAANLGTLVESDYAKAEPGGSASFTILFWTLDEGEFSVLLRVREKPDGWTVALSPPDFALPAKNSDRNIYLPARGYIKAFAASAYVAIPASSPAGSYDVVIDAAAGNPYSGVSVMQERVFRLHTEVMEKKTAADSSADLSQSSAQQGAATPVNNAAEKTDMKNGSATLLLNRTNQSNDKPHTVLGEKATERITGRAVSFIGTRTAAMALAIIFIFYASWRIYKKP